jgi:S1-C subfamily serine protease
MRQAVEQASQSVQPSVVQVQSRGASEGVLGSGIILTQDGYIVTNDHVVHGFRFYLVKMANGQRLTAQLVGEDIKNDLAVLKVKASNLTPVTFADSSTVKAGQFVVALGSPVGLDNTTTFGIVSALNRTITVGESSDSSATQEYTGLIQLDMTLNPGNSGSALVDLQGRLIGIPMAGGSTQSGEDVDGIGFAIPANRVKAVTTQLIQSGSSPMATVLIQS